MFSLFPQAQWSSLRARMYPCSNNHTRMLPAKRCRARSRVECFLSWLAAWGLVCVLLFLRCWSALMGQLSVLECAFWGFLLSLALLHVSRTIASLCNTLNRRTSTGLFAAAGPRHVTASFSYPLAVTDLPRKRTGKLRSTMSPSMRFGQRPIYTISYPPFRRYGDCFSVR